STSPVNRYRSADGRVADAKEIARSVRGDGELAIGLTHARQLDTPHPGERWKNGHGSGATLLRSYTPPDRRRGRTNGVRRRTRRKGHLPALRSPRRREHIRSDRDAELEGKSHSVGRHVTSDVVPIRVTSAVS